MYADGTNLSSTSYSYGMSIIVQKDKQLQSVSVELIITGSPTNTQFDICTANTTTGYPDSATGVIATAYLASPIAGMNTITFSPAVSLSANTQYFLVIRGTATNYVGVRRTSQGRTPAHNLNNATLQRTDFRTYTLTGDAGWGNTSTGENVLFCQFTDSTTFGSPGYAYGTVLSTTTPNQWRGNHIVLADDAPDMWLSAVHFGCRTAGTFTEHSKLGIFENNNLISETVITLGSALTNQLTSNWSDRLFYPTQPVRLRGGNRYFIALFSTSQATAGTYIQLTGLKCMSDKHNYVPLSATRAYRNSSGVLTLEPDYIVAMALGIDLVTPFAAKPLNRRQFNNQR